VAAAGRRFSAPRRASIDATIWADGTDLDADVERLLELHGRTMALDRVRALVRQLERPELLDDLEALIRRVSARADRE
jgi:hypothetical protein